MDNTQGQTLSDVKKTLNFVDENKLQVFCRLSSQLANETSCITAISSNTLQIKTKDNVTTQFNFESIFEDSVKQEEVFDNVGVPLIQRLFQNENGALLAYGATGSGKTFTIQGTQNDPGLLPRLLQTIIATIPESHIVCPPKRKPSPTETPKSEGIEIDLSYQYGILVSYYEIYNELIFDLLVDQVEKKVPLKLKTDKNGAAIIVNLTEQPVYDSRSAKKWLNFGLKNRNIRSTACNHDSSRSHCVFEIKVLQIEKDKKVDSPSKSAKLSIIDLAGTERASKTMASGERLREAININASLTTLSRCIEALRFNQNLENGQTPMVVPFRESKLTVLLRDNFYGRQQGNSQSPVGKISIMVNVNPKMSMVEETFHVLKFSSVAKTVTAQVAKTKQCTTAPAPFVLSKNVSKIRDTPTHGPPVQSPLRSPLRPVAPPDLNFDEDECIIHPLLILKEVDQLQAALKEAQDRCETIEIELREEISQEVRMNISELEDQYEKALFDQEDAFLGRIGILETQSSELAMELEDTYQRNDELVLQVQELSSQVEQLSAQVDVLEAISKPNPATDAVPLQQHKAIIFNLELKIFQLQEQVTELSSERENKMDIETTSQLVVKSQIDSIQAQISLLQEMNDALRRNHEENVRELNYQHKQELAKQNEEVLALQNENREMKQTVQQLGLTVTQNKETIQKLCNTKIKEIKTRSTTKSGIVDQMQEMVSDLLQEVSKLKGQQEKQKTEALAQDETITALKHELFKKRLELEITEEEVQSKDREIQKWKRELLTQREVVQVDDSPQKKRKGTDQKQPKSKKPKIDIDAEKENVRSPANSPIKLKSPSFLSPIKKGTGTPVSKRTRGGAKK